MGGFWRQGTTTGGRALNGPAPLPAGFMTGLGGHRGVAPASQAHAVSHWPRMLAGMNTPCWHCAFYLGLTAQGTAARCGQPACINVRSDPARGCAFYLRLTGCDDEPGPPPGYQGTSGTSWRDLSATGPIS